jgi:23S rRNA (guanine2445-N2)-methyltransferase / 23S rRNA (guanine2069-N7)-methyltransferase
VNLTDFLDTGLFLDHRTTRAMVYEQVRSAEKPVRFLNLFSYTSSVSLYAAAAGAQTTSVDMSNTYIDWSKRNFRQNDLLTDQHQFIKADCMQWLSKAMEDKQQYDLIFIDPPTFSNSKSMEQVFDVQKDHQQLIEMAMKLLAEDGEIIFSNNYRRFKISEQLRGEYDVQDISAKTIPEDFKRNQKIHHCFIIRPVADAAG